MTLKRRISKLEEVVGKGKEMISLVVHYVGCKDDKRVDYPLDCLCNTRGDGWTRNNEETEEAFTNRAVQEERERLRGRAIPVLFTGEPY